MNEDELYSSFEGRWLKHANEYFVARESAMDFATYLKQQNIRCLGIEGFVLDPALTRPMGVIADYSEQAPSQKNLEEFLTFGMDAVTHFNFVLDSMDDF
jgi:kynurenine formamidase